MRCPRQRIWRFALQLWLAAGPVANHLMASVVGHIFPAANFFACPKPPQPSSPPGSSGSAFLVAVLSITEFEGYRFGGVNAT
jgi:hypothetical protein